MTQFGSVAFGPYERSQERRAHANNYKPKTVKTRVDNVTFDIPQVREGGFYPDVLEKGQRSQRVLILTLAEMYVQEVSTCKVLAIVEKLCGMKISASQVGRAVALLDETLESWRNRPLGIFPSAPNFGWENEDWLSLCRSE